MQDGSLTRARVYQRDVRSLDDREEPEAAVGGRAPAWVRRAVRCRASEEDRDEKDEKKQTHRRPVEERFAPRGQGRAERDMMAPSHSPG